MQYFLLLLLVPFAASANDGPLQVQTLAQKEQSVTLADGTVQTQLVEVTTVVPGDEVIYTIRFTNTGEESAAGVTITDPVPAEMRYIDGSAFSAGTDILFSANGGASWGKAGELTVSDNLGIERVATAADFTHIRWRMRHPLAAGKTGYARFRAALR